MSVNIKFKRGTTAQVMAYTGAAGTIVINTETNEIHLQDGITPGGKVIGAFPEVENPTGLHLRTQGAWVPLDETTVDMGTLSAG